MRKGAAKRDANHKEIVRGLRAIGCSVHDAGAIGGGFPDLVVGYRGANFLIEIKNPNRSPAQRALTPEQVMFRDAWRGSYYIVESLEEAIEIVTRTGAR